MGMRFRKSVKICKGLKVNFSKSGASVSLGGRGHRLTVGGRGARVTVGIPGTGLSYSTKIGGNSGRRTTTKSRKVSSKRTSRPAVQVPSQVQVSMNDKGHIELQLKNILKRMDLKAKISKNSSLKYCYMVLIRI